MTDKKKSRPIEATFAIIKKSRTNPSTELKNLVPSDFATIVDEVVTSIKRDQKKYAKAVKQKESEEKDLLKEKISFFDTNLSE